MSLYQKHRPTSFDMVLGSKNQATIKSIRAVIEGGSPPHSFLLKGPHGCGKTTMGRLIANELGCVDDDFREIDSADFRGIDSIREIRRVMHFKPLHGERRAWLLDEVHKTSGDAQSALLKGLEDPPPHCYFILCTTDPEKLLPTIRSRCAIYEVHRLTDDDMMKLLRRIAQKEGVQLTRSVLESIVDGAKGHPRDAIQILQQVSSSPETAAALIEGRNILESKVLDLYQALIRGTGWKSVRSVLSELKATGEDAEGVRRYVLACCSNALLQDANDRAGIIMEQFLLPFYDVGFPGLVFACYSIVREPVPV